MGFGTLPLVGVRLDSQTLAVVGKWKRFQGCLMRQWGLIVPELIEAIDTKWDFKLSCR